MKGRKRTVQAIKDRRGKTPGRPSGASSGVVALDGVPAAPAHLSKAAREEFERLAGLLVERQTITAADLPALALLASSLGIVRELSAILAREDYFYEVRGLRRPRPEIAMRSAAWRQSLAGLAEFGLTPASRGKAGAVASGELDRLSEMLGAVN